MYNNPPKNKITQILFKLNSLDYRYGQEYRQMIIPYRKYLYTRTNAFEIAIEGKFVITANGQVKVTQCHTLSK